MSLKNDGFFDVGGRIRALRDGLSQAEFAERLGVDRKSVNGWETGKRLPDGTSLLKLMTEFGADVNYILTGQRGGQKMPPLQQREAALLENYRASDETGRRIVEGAAVAAAQPRVGRARGR